jgi:hypothetical protein
MFGIIKSKLSKEANEKKEVEISNVNFIESSGVVEDEEGTQNLENSNEAIEPNIHVVDGNAQQNLSNNLQVINWRFEFCFVVW